MLDDEPQLTEEQLFIKKIEERHAFSLADARRLMTKKGRVGLWVSKVWDHLDSEVGICVPERRLISELGVKEVTTHVRNEMRRRGLVVKKITRRVGNTRKVFYWVRRKRG